MKVQHAEFAASAYTLEQLLQDKLPQVALAGSSNVGKSSLINQLGRSPKLAKISSTPGKTASINYYRFNKAFYLVDLPGYGYAKVSAKTKAAWSELIEGYFEAHPRLVGTVLIVDIRHAAKPDDLNFYRWAAQTGLPVAVVANKADKLSKNQQVVSVRQLAADLEVDPASIIPFSAEKGTGKEALLRAIEGMLASPSAPETRA